MNSKEILTSIKVLVGLSKEEVTTEVEATEEVVLSTEEVVEEVIEEKVEEVELSTEEIAKPIKHNPESKGEVEMNLYAQNKPMSTQDRVFAKLFKN